jgi:hypothetical protein
MKLPRAANLTVFPAKAGTHAAATPHFSSKCNALLKDRWLGAIGPWAPACAGVTYVLAAADFSQALREGLGPLSAARGRPGYSRRSSSLAARFSPSVTQMRAKPGPSGVHDITTPIGGLGNGMPLMIQR